MGVETVIDGKSCFFTADNFFHQDMFTGSGGWMGLNRAFPPNYAASAKKVLDAAPDWGTGGTRRAVRIPRGETGAPDCVGPGRGESGSMHFRLRASTCIDYNPHHVRIEPVVLKAKPGDICKATLVI